MSLYLDEAAITGVAPKGEKGAAPPPKGATFLDEAQITGVDPIDAEAKAGPSLASLGADIGKRAVSLAASTGDMILGAPASLASKFLNVGARAFAAATGESRAIQGQAGQLAEHLGPLEGLKTPLQTLAKTLTGAEPWDQSVVNNAMEKVNVAAEKLSGGALTKEDSALLVGTLMDVMGVKGLKAGADMLAKPKAAATGEGARASYDEQPPAPGEEAAPAPGEAPFRQQMPEVRTAAEVAKITKERKADVRAAFKDTDTADHLQFKANETMEGRAAALVADAEKNGRTTAADDWPAIAKDAYEISQKPGHLRTPEEMIRLREYNTRAFADQQGKVDPEMLPYVLAAIATGTAGGLAVYKYLKHLQDTQTDEEQEQGRATRKAIFDRTRQEQMPDWITPDEKGLNLERFGRPPSSIMADAGGVLGVAALAVGAIKGRMELRPAGDIALALTKAEKGFFDSIHKSPADLAELKSEVPGVKYEAGKLILPDQATVAKLQDYADKTVTASKGEGLEKLPPSFYKGDFAKLAQAEKLPTEASPADSGTTPQGPAAEEAGSADPKLLAKIAAVGGGAALGAYLDPEHPIAGMFKGAIGGILVTKINPRAIADAVKRASVDKPLIKIDDMARETVYARGQAKRAVYQLSTKIEKAVPDAARREAIFRSLDGDTSVKLNAAEAKVAKDVRIFYDNLGAAAKESGVIKEVLDNYATRIYGPESRSLFGTRPVGPNMSLDSPFGKRRNFPTLAQAEAAGHHPTTLDISKVVEAYSDSITNALENRNFIRSLKAAQAPEGAPLIAKEGKAPHDYVFIDHSQLRGLRVHPDIAGDLKFIFDQTSPPAIVRALDAINTTQKRMAVSMSLFHAAALEHAALGATALMKSPLRSIKILGQSFAPMIFGENVALKMIKEGGAGDSYDLAMKSGLQMGLERQSPALQELKSGFYEMMGKVSDSLDRTIPQLGKQTVGRFTQLNHMFDRAMWGRFHTTWKLTTWMDKVSELSMNNARDVAAGKAALKSQDEIGRMAASFTNDVFGGLDWQGIVQEFDSRWGRELASAALGPSGRLEMRLLLFAPDWTISTTRAFLKAFGQQGVAAGAGAVLGSQIDPEHKILGGALGAMAGLAAGKVAGLKAGGGSGIKGLWRPTELADLHRQYLMRSAFIYTAIVDTLNVQMSGHHIWDNKDPTRLDRGDGTTQQVSKHFMEPFHWLMTPRQQAMNKLSYVVKEPLAQLQDVDYLSATGAPRMGGTPKGQDISLGTRVAHAARGLNPIAVQQSWDNSATKGVAGFLGAPIYGHTKEERAAMKAEAKRRAIQRRIDKRAGK